MTRRGEHRIHMIHMTGGGGTGGDRKERGMTKRDCYNTKLFSFSLNGSEKLNEIVSCGDPCG